MICVPIIFSLMFVDYGIQMREAGQTKGEITDGCGLMFLGASLQNRLNWSLLNESAR